MAGGACVCKNCFGVAPSQIPPSICAKANPSPFACFPACQSPASKTPQCGVLRVEPDLREGGEHKVPDEISRDEDASKVVRPRFRMGLKPTALLRHAAKVRLADGSLRMTRDGFLQSAFLYRAPLRHTACATSPHGRGYLAVAFRDFECAECKRSKVG